MSPEDSAFLAGIGVGIMFSGLLGIVVVIILGWRE